MALETHLSSILAWGSALLTGLFAVLGVWISNRSSLRQLEVRRQIATRGGHCGSGLRSYTHWSVAGVMSL